MHKHIWHIYLLTQGCFPSKSGRKNDIKFKKSVLMMLLTVIVHTVRSQLLKEILSSE